MKKLLLMLSLVLWCQSAWASNCGVHSATALSHVMGGRTTEASSVAARYPFESVSMLQVKQMSAELGISTQGVRATLPALLEAGTPVILSLRDPDHFLLLLDGDQKEVRVIDGENLFPKILPFQQLEKRFTGLALVPVYDEHKDAPRLRMSFDRYQQFSGIGQTIHYIFPLQNTGQRPLRVQIQGVSCGCTGAAGPNGEKELVIAPQEKSQITVALQVNTRAPVQEIVSLTTNDPRRPQVILSVRGQLPPLLRLSPPSLYIEQNVGEQTHKQFKVIGPCATQIQEISSDNPALRFVVQTPEHQGETVHWLVRVEGLHALPEGRIRSLITIDLNDGQQLQLLARGRVAGPIAPSASSDAAPGAAKAATLPRAEDDPRASIAVAAPPLRVGETAPEFTLTDMNGRMWRLSELRGHKHLLLTFFPRCFTGGCATHLSSLREVYPQLQARGVELLAVSVDEAEGERGQLAFAQRWRLPFALVPDPERTLSQLFGATQNQRQLAGRLSVLIDKEGVVRWVTTEVDTVRHGSDALSQIEALGLD